MFNPDYRPMEFPMGQILPDASKPYLLGVGWYRKSIFVPEDQDGNSFILQVGPCVMNAAVWCNGKKVMSHIGYSTGFKSELTDFIQAGQSNEIVIAVSNAANDRRGCAIRGYQGRRGGIGGGVQLKVAGKSYINDFHVRFDAGKLAWNVELAGNEFAATELEWSVLDHTEKCIHSSGVIPVKGLNINFISEAAGLQAWSDRKPELCQLKLVLKQHSTIIDHAVRRWGCRELAVSGYKILLNGRPVYLRGSTEHCYFPETCNPHWNKAEYKDNIRKLKKVGFNWLRFHTWCPPEPYLDAADEEGIFVQIEVPRYSTECEWEDIIRLARRHPSVIIVCGGNEDLIDESRIEELRQLAGLCKLLAPDCLFNPQEGLHGVEYGEPANMGVTCNVPFEHNPQRLAALAEFSDVYGTFNAGSLSYFTGDFDNPAELDRGLTIYGKPCLAHEVGILGNYMNLNLEKRYANTYIGTELFAGIRKYLDRSGLLKNASRYYLNSCQITGIIRKHTLENARRCSHLSGYDFLGGVDTHWHRCGYPCGILNEFYELKPGQSEREILAYNGESVLLLEVGCCRNILCGEKFSRKIEASYWGQETISDSELTWYCLLADGTILRSGSIAVPMLIPGKITEIGSIDFTIPSLVEPAEAVLICRLDGKNVKLENEWNFWFFPAVEAAAVGNKLTEKSPGMVSTRLTAGQLQYLTGGGSIILTDNFPMDMVAATFQPTQTGRVSGDLATVIYDHPALNDFPHRGFCDWQFYSLLKDSRSMIFNNDLIPFKPLIEIVSSFKHIRRKAALCEFKVGSGRLMMASLNFRNEDPAACTLFQKLLQYLTGYTTFDAPALDVSVLEKQIADNHHEYQNIKTDCALDPNA